MQTFGLKLWQRIQSSAYAVSWGILGLFLMAFPFPAAPGSTDAPAANSSSAEGVGAASPKSNLATNVSIFIVHDPLATDAFRPRGDRVRELVQRGLLAATGQSTITAAWLSLVSTQDVVGIKVLSQPGLCGTRVDVVAGLAQGLIDAGLPRDHIVIWDKMSADLQAAGFVDLAKQLGVRVQSSHAAGYDEAVAYTNSALGYLSWVDHEFNRTGDDVGKRSFFSKLVTRQLTKIVNVAPLLNHYRAGVAGCLYSLSMGSVDNTQRFESSPDRLAEAVPEIYAQEPLLDKVVLHVVDALLAQYQGESQTLLHYTRPMNELRFSRDPVALDLLSLKDLESLRRVNQIITSTNTSAIYQKLYQENAALLELGIADPNKVVIQRR